MLSAVCAVLRINAFGAMGSPCVRPPKDIHARIESALDAIDEISHDALPLKSYNNMNPEFINKSFVMVRFH
jgi:hypothetical protein